MRARLLATNQQLSVSLGSAPVTEPKKAVWGEGGHFTTCEEVSMTRRVQYALIGAGAARPVQQALPHNLAFLNAAIARVFE